MRGKEAAAVFQRTGAGITPAYAGKRTAQSERYARERDHPRVCGEKIYTNLGEFLDKGSPPRMRGKAAHSERVEEFVGITPAYAGKSTTPGTTRTAEQDHPRVCGEKRRIPVRRTVWLGSPPRMRGKVFASPPAMLPTGITPAYAGKRGLPSQMRAPSWDHPRVCGEKGGVNNKLSINAGSPPRMRGKEKYGRANRMSKGITPAYAGKRRPLPGR